MNLITEYLIILVKSAAQATYNLCGTVADFNRLVAADPLIALSGKTISYGQLRCEYQVLTSDIKSADEQRFFHVRLAFSGTESDIETYTKLLRSIRSTATSVGHCETIWDDVARHYSELSYPLIHKAESLMRKLITYFMLTTVGKDWIDTKSPSELKDAVKGKGKEREGGKLHQVNFNTLKDALFKAYSSEPVTTLHAALRSKSAPHFFTLEQLQEYLPKSNWDRYFSDVVECDGAYIEKVWTELYDLRNAVAHNALIGRVQFERIAHLVNDLSQHLQKAIENIGRIHVPLEAKDQVAENIITNISAASSIFIEEWKACESLIHSMSEEWGVRHSSIQEAIAALSEEEFLDIATAQKADEMRKLRHRLVHDAGGQLQEQDIETQTGQLKQLSARLQHLLHPATWKKEIAAALDTLGGEGSLADIYETIHRTTARDLPENWKSCIRYNLQLNSSDTETFSRGSGEDLFQKVGRGRWKLRTTQ